MSYIEKNLLPEERILYRTQKHFIIFLTPVIWSLITAFFLFSSYPALKNVAFLIGIVSLLSWAKELLNYVTAVFVLTNKRIIMKEGFFFRHTNETRLATLANVSIDQSLIGQLLDYGTVIINTFGGENDPFTQIASPLEFRKQVLTQLDKVSAAKNTI